jgi:hypothetical protein
LSSTEQSLDIINYDTGNFNFYLNPGGSGTGSYNWFKPSLGLIMTLSGVTGNLGINSSSPSSRLSVGGDVQVSGTTTTTNLNVTGSFTPTNLSASGDTILGGTLGISTSTSYHTLQVGGNPSVTNGVGISSNGNIIVSNQITSKNISATGIITSTGGFDCGAGTPMTILVSGTQLTLTVPGVGSTVLTLS